MSLYSTILNAVAAPLKMHRRVPSRQHATDPRILVIRRNRMGDMIYTLPLLQALRRHFPGATLTVACDPLGAPIAQACAAVNEVLVLESGWNPWWAAVKNAWCLQNFDWVIAAKGGFDRRLAVLARLSNAAVRIGFEKITGLPSPHYTEVVLMPEGPNDEHQIETMLRLLKPLGMVKAVGLSSDLYLRVPEESKQFAAEVFSQPAFQPFPRFALINFSSTVGLKFREEDFIALARRILTSTSLSIGFVAAPVDQQKAIEVADCMASKRVVGIQTPGPLDLAALLERAAFLLTPEGGAAHLAAAMNTPSLVIWSEGPFKKWYSRGKNHAYVHAEPGETYIPLERVWTELQLFLPTKNDAAPPLLQDYIQNAEAPPPPSILP